MKFTRIIAASIALCALGATAFAEGQKDAGKAAAPQAEVKPIVLRLGETHPQDYPTTKGDYKFAELVKAKTNGRIVIEVYPGSQLGQEKAVIEQVQFGAIDFTRVSISVFSTFSPQMNSLQMPYLFRDIDHQWKVLKGPIGQDLLASLDAQNFVGIGWFEAGARSFYNTKKPVTKPEDLEGMKIRVQESDLMVSLVKAFGAVATPMPYGEVYSALQTGVIDGAENNTPSYFSASHYEVAKHYTLDEHTRVPEIIVGSKIALAKLSPADIKILKEAAAEAADYQRAEWAAYEKVSEDKVLAAGSKIVRIADKAPWQAKMASFYARQSPETQAMIKKIAEVK